MLRSIRWTLQLWHAAILVLAVLGIGLTSFLAIQQARYGEVDAELEAAGQLMVARLHAPGPRDRPPFGRFDMDPHGQPGGNDPSDGPGPKGPGWFGMDDSAGPPRDFPRGMDGPNGPPHEPDRLPRFIEMPPGFLERYSRTDQDARSFVVFRSDGIVAKEMGAPYDTSNLPHSAIRPAEHTVVRRVRQAMHEIYLPGPAGSTVLVAGSVQPVNDQLRSLIGKMVAAAIGILIVGLAGGWIISRLAVRPIGLMSVTAGSISATKLAGRIDARRVPTELKELALVLNGMFQRLETAFQQQVRFTADASHELRTPLAVILSHTELALSRDRSVEELRRTIEICSNAASRMKSLVESLLLLSHADVGELALQPVLMDLSDLVRENVTLLHGLAATRSITIATQLQDVTLLGDPLRLGQVVGNLLSNAIRYNHDGGSIAVSTQVLLGDAVLVVADTGAGISVDDQQHIFDRFFRADKARNRDKAGSGLGLAICKSIVDAHGGIVEVTSEPSVGTTFTVRLPRGIEATKLLLPEKIEV